MEGTTTQEVRKFVMETFLLGDGDRLNDDSSFIEDGLIDSTGILELVSFIEEHYNIAIADHELIPDNLDSVNKVARFVQCKLASVPHEQLAAQASW